MILQAPPRLTSNHIPVEHSPHRMWGPQPGTLQKAGVTAPRGHKWIIHVMVLWRVTFHHSRRGVLCSTLHLKITAGLHPSLPERHASHWWKSKGPSWMVPFHHFWGYGCVDVFLSSKTILAVAHLSALACSCCCSTCWLTLLQVPEAHMDTYELMDRRTDDCQE